MFGSNSSAEKHAIDQTLLCTRPSLSIKYSLNISSSSLMIELGVT